MTKKPPLEEMFGITGLPEKFGVDGDVTGLKVDRPTLGTDPVAHIKDAVGPDPVFAIDEDGNQKNPFARDSALLQTVEGALDDANQARIDAASEVLGFQYIP